MKDTFHQIVIDYFLMITRAGRGSLGGPRVTVKGRGERAVVWWMRERGLAELWGVVWWWW